MTNAHLTVGVLGLGNMGLPMAQHLLRERGALSVWSRTRRSGDLEAAGARWAETPRALAADADVILVMLPDLPQLEQALDGPDGILAAQRPLTLLIGSTSSPTGVRALAERLAPHGIAVADCPVSGGEDGARAGTLSIMIGGDDATARVASEVLSACGTPEHLGPLGAGEVAKACNQMIVASTILALADAAVLAARSGIDLDRLFTLLGRGYAGSRLLESRKAALIDEDYRPSGPAKYMVKDLGFAHDVAEATGTTPALLDVLRERFDALVAAGLGDQDLSVARRFVEER